MRDERYIYIPSAAFRSRKGNLTVVRIRDSADKAAVDLSLRRDVYERLRCHADSSRESESAIVERALHEFFDLIDSCGPEARDLIRLLTSSDG